MEEPTYRPDIDGLRAIAVVAVIAFHFGVAGFSGGYVGVDVFFVISGFLITQILVRDHQLGRFTIAHFYERRARRIIPALVTVLALTLAIGWVFLTPTEYSNLGKATLSALTFVSNVLFWRGSGYFEAGAMRPILHTWSLAVEEQFYIAYPLVLAVLFKFRRRWITVVILSALLTSFLLSAVGAFLSPSATFFLIPTRAWELMVGAALALGLVPPIRHARVAEVIAISGLFLLCLAVGLYNERTYFPGAAALLPCVGTAMLIHSGRDHRTRPRSLLAWRPIVTVGLMSYSLYLYHFPIHLYAVRAKLDDLSWSETAAAMALTFTLAFLSWRYIESPFRQRGRFNRAQIFVAAVAASIAVAIPAAFVAATGGFPERFTRTEQQMLSASEDFSQQGRKCINMPVEATGLRPACRLGNPTSTSAKPFGDFILVGDSHAAAIAPAVANAAAESGRSGTMIAFNACAPLLGVDAPSLSWSDARKCRGRNSTWVELAKTRGIEMVILTAYWSGHLKDWARDEDDGGRYMAGALDRTLGALAGKRIVILLDVPHGEFPPGLQAVFARRFGRPLQQLHSDSEDPAATIIRTVAAGRAQVIDQSAPFCAHGVCQAFDQSGHPILADNNHVTATAARNRLTSVLKPVFARGARRSAPR
jgi:peptidoglycan/LPS O-acetylase OafA/YrhL